MDSDRLLLDEGEHAAVEAVPQENAAAQLKISAHDTFANLSEQYAFYTPALIFIYGGLPFNIVEQFYVINNLLGKSKPHLLVMDEPVFEGLESPVYGRVFNHVLFAIEKEHWASMALHLGTVGLKDSSTGTYYGTEIQKLPMADYLALRQCASVPDQVPMFEMYAVALDGNKRCLHFTPSINPPIDRIALLNSPPNTNVINYANDLFKGGK